MADPTTNPYLALLQQEDKPPSLAQILQHVANLGFGMAGGLGQAASQGGSTISGLGTGLVLGNQINAQQAQRAEQERMKRLEWQFRAQEHEDKRAEMIRQEKAREDFARTGFNVVPQQPQLMGPGGTPTTGPQPAAAPGPDLKTAGAPLVDYLVTQHGLSPLAASTVVGNLYQESNFNPSATGDSGSAFGMAQWRLDRQTGLRNFAATQNKPVTDPQVQIDYLVSEMKGGDMGAQRAYAGLQQAKTPEQANAAMMHFFRPAGYTPANPTGGLGYDRRVANTRALLPQGRPSDPTTAPVPTVDPYAVAAPPPGPAPRPGLGPRATPPGPDGPQGPVAPGGSPVDPNAQPPPFVAPDGVPVAQGGGEGEEVVLPRIGLPFPAQARAPAPPGSVPFPTISAAPGGPVQPNYTPTQPGMVPQAPGGGPAPSAADAPPQRPVTPMPQPDADVVARARAGYLAKALTADQAVGMVRQNVMDKYKQAEAAADAQYAANLEVYKQRQESGRHARGEEARLKAEERAQARQLEASERAEKLRLDAEARAEERRIAAEDRKRAAETEQAGTKRGDEQTKARIEDENKLRDDFDKSKVVASYRIVVPMLESAKDAAARPTRAADLNLIYAFAKLMDPESVVRESEAGMVSATASVADRLSAYIGQLNGKPQLPPEVRAKLIAELDSRFNALKASYEAHEEAYRGIAERRGHNFDNIRIPIRPNKPTIRIDAAGNVQAGQGGHEP